MTRKWLRSDYDEASEWLEDHLMSGESYLTIDIAKILDGYPVDDLILASAKRNQDEVNRILKSHVERFMATETGQKMIDSRVREIRQEREANHVDYLIDQKKEAFA